MITIDNKEVTGVTINGDKVNEITMDGDVVWLENLFSITYETSAKGIKTIDFDTGANLRQFIMDNKTTFINHCKVVAKLPEITDCSSLFRYCTASSLDLSSFDTSNVTNMGAMFYNSKATTLDLSTFDTSSVTSMSYMFHNSQATTLDLSSFNTSNVTNMGFMFYNSKATTLDLSSFDTSSVTTMSYMFYSSQATTLDLSSFDTSSVTNMTRMFNSSQATTGYARTQADADKFNASSDKPAALVFIVKPDFYIDYETSSGTQTQSFTTGALLRQFILDNKTTFINNCKVVAKLPEITSCYNLFRDSKATTLDLSSFNTSNVTDMTYMFYSSQATSLDLSSFDTSNVTTMRSMFSSSQATTLDLSSFNTSNVTDMGWMFNNSQATTGYARTQADADRFNASSGKPAGLVFVVK